MRSYLFVPGDSEKKLEKALTAGADALIVDLEDSVAPGEKARGRAVAAAFLARAAGVPDRPRLLVRVNALDTDLIGGDLDAVMPAAPDGIVVPKAAGGHDVAHLAAMIAVREAEYDLADGGTTILAIATETAKGIFALGTYGGASHRLRGLAWGGEDLSADVGAEANRDETGAYTEPNRLARSLSPVRARRRRAESGNCDRFGSTQVGALSRDVETGFAAVSAAGTDAPRRVRGQARHPFRRKCR